MIKLFAFFIATIVVFAASFLFWAFVVWDLNILNWHPLIRLFAAGLPTLLMIASLDWLISDEE